MSYQNQTFRSRRSRPVNRNRNNSRRPRGQYIDPARFVNIAKPAEAEEYTPANTFDSFQVAQLLKANLENKGYKTPTPIQDKTIQVALEGKDVIGIADTGTGKTAAFAIPILHQLMDNRSSKALIIAPTRELAEQIIEELRWMARGSGLSGTLLIGGTSMSRQISELRGNPRVVVGTPGRIKDHIERRILRLSSFNILVLDEVDRMLDMGFVNDVRSILSQLAEARQSFFFSATVDNRVADLIQTFSHDPVTVSIKTGEASENIHQNVVSYATSTQKIEKLHDVLIQGNVTKALLFEETRRSVEKLSKELVARGFKANAIHGGKTQGQRQRALDSFKNSEINILVATDVAARGIDVADITHVINYSIPQSYGDYVHRIGRAGRAGKIGHALTFVGN